MKLEKAIEISLAHILYQPSKVTPNEHDAIKLGIEALKRVEHTRHEAPEFVIPLLPGETEE